MAQKMMERDFIHKVAAVLIAAALWFFVAYAENPEKELWFRDIPITFAGEGALSDVQLARVKGGESTVSVKVKGSRSAIVALSAADIVATVDLSSVKEAKAYTFPVSIKFPVDGLVLSDKKPYSVTFEIEDIVTREVLVAVEPVGTAAAGVEIAECSAAVESVKISGGRSTIEKVESLVARPDIGTISEDKKLTCALEVKMKDGSVGHFEDIKIAKTHTDVNIKVNITRDVPVNAVFGGEMAGAVKSSRVQPETVKISGSYEKIRGITKIDTKPIEISGKYETEKINARLDISEDVKVSEGSETVTVEVTIAKEDVVNE